MTAGRIVSTVISCAAVAGCAVVVVGMTRAASEPRRDDRNVAARVLDAAPTERPAYVPRRTTTSSPAPATTSATTAPVVRPATSPAAPGTTGSTTVRPAAPAPATSVPPARPTVRPAPATTAAPRVVVRAPAPAATRRPAPVASTPAVRRAPAPAAAPAGSVLPLRYTTGSATRVITVTAGSSRSTKARFQAWSKLSNGRWAKYGAAVTAYVGSDGIGTASETRSKTPAGSYTVTQTFGARANPGTRLPYVRTTPSDYWISSPGSKYNTRQRCGSCGYNNGVNERLYYTTPFYNYAAVIDYNTRNAPGGVKQGRGSAFFLHVSTGSPTAGCVAIPQSKLVSILRWLTPSAKPRILIGVT